MKPDLKLLRIPMLACALSLSACGSSAESELPHHTGAGGMDVPKCMPEELVFTSGPNGMVAMGERMRAQVRVLAANPLQPKRFENDWTVGFLDAAGQPLAGVDVTSACAYMPLHGHFEPALAIERQSDPSTFLLKALNLSMRGPWKVQLTITSTAIGGAPSAQTQCDVRGTKLGHELITIPVCIEDQGS